MSESDKDLTRSPKIRVSVVDDNPVFLDSLIKSIGYENDIEVIGFASNGHSAVALAKELQPDVVIMDVEMPVLNGIEATQIIARDFPHVRVIGLSMSEGDSWIDKMRKAGAQVCVRKDSPRTTVLDAIRVTVNPLPD